MKQRPRIYYSDAQKEFMSRYQFEQLREHSVIMGHGLFPFCFTMTCRDFIVTKQRGSGLFIWVLNGMAVVPDNKLA
jgi:hypothetical protein